MKTVAEIYPRVYKSNTRDRVFVRFSGSDEDEADLKIKIQPMEKYSAKHVSYRVDEEEERYPYVDLLKLEDNLYYVDYDFFTEQKYTAKIKIGDKPPRTFFLYSVDEDLAAMNPYKGDTHLHTCRSDGKGTPFEVGCAFRACGFDFIAITDHQKHFPSIEARDIFRRMTEEFCVYPGEEIHNKGMGYFHIVNFGSEKSITGDMGRYRPILEEKAQRLIESTDFSSVPDPYNTAWRIAVADEIRALGGVAIMAHPYWATFGQYHMQTDDVLYLWRHGHYDALEVIASCDGNGNGNNLQEALRAELLYEGIKVPVVGASDAHTVHPEKSDEHFNIQYTVAFAPALDKIKEAILDERSVAVFDRGGGDFHVVGRFRYVKYARFLLGEYFPQYRRLTEEHSAALAALGEEGQRSEAVALIEEKIEAFRKKFFSFK